MHAYTNNMEPHDLAGLVPAFSHRCFMFTCMFRDRLKSSYDVWAHTGSMAIINTAVCLCTLCGMLASIRFVLGSQVRLCMLYSTLKYATSIILTF